MQLDLMMKNTLGFIEGSFKRDDYKANSEKNQWIAAMHCPLLANKQCA